MELAVLAAGVDVGRKGVDKIPVDDPAQGGLIQIGIANTTYDRSKAEADKLCNNLTRVELPKRKETAHPNTRESLFAPAPKILEKDVAKRNARYAVLLVREQMGGNVALVLVIRTAVDKHYVQRQAYGACLRLR